MKQRLQRSRKTTAAGLALVALTAALQAIAPELPDAVAPLADHPRWSWVPIAVGVLLMAIGPALKRAGKPGDVLDLASGARRGGLRHNPDNLFRASALPLALAFALAFGALPAGSCGKAAKTLPAVAEHTARIASALASGEATADALLAAGALTADAHRQVKPIVAAAAHVAAALDAEVKALAAGGSRIEAAARIVPLAAELVAKFRQVRSLVGNANAQRILGAAETGLRAVAAFFALARSDLNSEGVSDARIAKAAGCDVAAVAEIVSYAEEAADQEAGAASGEQ